MIPKGGKNLYFTENYRLISHLEVLGKVFERIINHQLRTCLENSDVHSDLQFGYLQGRGTTHLLALVTETTAQCNAKGGQCHLVLRDVKKNFRQSLTHAYEVQNLASCTRCNSRKSLM